MNQNKKTIRTIKMNPNLKNKQITLQPYKAIFLSAIFFHNAVFPSFKKYVLIFFKYSKNAWQEYITVFDNSKKKKKICTDLDTCLSCSAPLPSPPQTPPPGPIPQPGNLMRVVRKHHQSSAMDFPHKPLHEEVSLRVHHFASFKHHS